MLPFLNELCPFPPTETTNFISALIGRPPQTRFSISAIRHLLTNYCSALLFHPTCPATLMLSRASVLVRRANAGRRVINISTERCSKRTQHWTELLDALDQDERPMVITARDQPFTIRAVNDSWSKLCGFSHAEAVGKSLQMIQGPATSPREVDRLARLLGDKSAPDVAVDVSLVNYTKDRRPFLNRVHVTPIDVTIDGHSTPMFVGALSFRRWCDPEPAAKKSSDAAAPGADQPPHFELSSALSHSRVHVAEPLAALVLGKQAQQYDLRSLGAGGC